VLPLTTLLNRFATIFIPAAKPMKVFLRNCSRNFRCLEEALESMGVKVWPEIYLEADDALAATGWFVDH
jgi:hypothetical protein